MDAVPHHVMTPGQFVETLIGGVFYQQLRQGKLPSTAHMSQSAQKMIGLVHAHSDSNDATKSVIRPNEIVAPYLNGLASLVDAFLDLPVCLPTQATDDTADDAATATTTTAAVTSGTAPTMSMMAPTIVREFVHSTLSPPTRFAAAIVCIAAGIREPSVLFAHLSLVAWCTVHLSVLRNAIGVDVRQIMPTAIVSQASVDYVFHGSAELAACLLDAETPLLRIGTPWFNLATQTDCAQYFVVAQQPATTAVCLAFVSDSGNVVQVSVSTTDLAERWMPGWIAGTTMEHGVTHMLTVLRAVVVESQTIVNTLMQTWVDLRESHCVSIQMGQRLLEWLRGTRPLFISTRVRVSPQWALHQTAGGFGVSVEQARAGACIYRECGVAHLEHESMHPIAVVPDTDAADVALTTVVYTSARGMQLIQQLSARCRLFARINQQCVVLQIGNGPGLDRSIDQFTVEIRDRAPMPEVVWRCVTLSDDIG